MAEESFTVRENIPEIAVKMLNSTLKDQHVTSQIFNDEENTKIPKKKKKAKKDEYGKRILTTRQQFILQVNGWLGQLQQASWMSTRVKTEEDRIKYADKIRRFKRLVEIKLEEAELVGFKLEFFEGTGRYRGVDKDYEIEEIPSVSEEVIKEKISFIFLEKIARTEEALLIARRAISALAIQGKIQTAEFQQHLASTNKLEFEESLLKELQEEIAHQLHLIFSSIPSED